MISSYGRYDYWLVTAMLAFMCQLYQWVMKVYNEVIAEFHCYIPWASWIFLSIRSINQ